MNQREIAEMRLRADRERQAAAKGTSSEQQRYIALAESYERVADAFERLLALRP